MTDYIAELDEMQDIAAVWVKENSARGPSVFDPKKHIFDSNRPSGYFGAPKEKIMNWIVDAQQQDRLLR